MVVFWKRLPPKEGSDKSDQQKTNTVLRYYFVFNIAQIDDLPEVVTIPYPEAVVAQFRDCEELVERMPNCPRIRFGKQEAYYDPEKDYINMPKQGSFTSTEAYYCTLFHELVHSTGHQTRLNRREIVEPNKFGSDPYSVEELIAEIGACYLSSITGIMNKEFDNSMAYIKGWIDQLRNDSTMIVYASGQAQRATDYILGVQSYQKSKEMLVAEKQEQTQ